jgi:hypothetical protein
MLPGLMGLLAVLMVSNVPYPAVPTVGFRSLKQLGATIILLIALVGAFFRPRQFFFPAMLAYVLYGALKWLFLGLIGSRAEPDEIYFRLEPEEELAAAPLPPAPARRTPVHGFAPPTAVDVDGVAPRRKRRRRRRGDGRRGEREPNARQERPSATERFDRGSRPTPSKPARPPAGAPNDQSSGANVTPPAVPPKNDTE